MAWPSSAQPFESLWRHGHRHGLQVVHSPIARDFDYDGRQELLLSDSAGLLVLLDAASGRELWKLRLEQGASLAPVPGHFTEPEGPWEIAVLGQAGRVDIVRASDGVRLRSEQLPSAGPEARYLLAPSLVPGGGDEADRLLAVREDRRLSLIEAEGEGGLRDLWQERAVGTTREIPLHAPAVGFLEPGSLAAFFVTAGRKAMVVDIAREQVRTYSVEGENVRLHPLLLHEASGRVARVILQDGRGNLYPYAVASDGTLQAEGRRRMGYSQLPEVTPPVADLNGDGMEDFALQAENRLLMVDGQSLQPMSGVEVFVSVRRFVTPAALYSDARGGAALVLVDDGGALQLVRPFEENEQNRQLRMEFEAADGTTPLVLAGPETRRPMVFVQTVSGLALLGLPGQLSADAAGWTQAQGGPLRGGGPDPLYRAGLARLDARIGERLREVLAQGEAALETGDYEQVLRLSGEVLRFSPGREAARDLRSRANARLHSTLYRSFWALGALVLLALLYGAWRWRAGRTLLRRARELSRSGRGEAILPLFERHQRIHRRLSLPALRLLAALARAHDFLPLSFRERLEKAHALRPDDADLTLCLARIYLHEQRRDDRALEVLRVAVRLDAEPRAFELALGRLLLERGEPAQARPHLEAAYTQNERSPELFDALADCYAALELLKPRLLPVFEAAAMNRPDEPRVLEALVRCYLNARMQKDQRCRKAVEQLLKSDPDSALGNQESAGILYREGRLEEAASAARRCLAVEPENPLALFVLAHQLWQQNQRDPESRDIYRRALQGHPEDNFLLKVNASLALEGGSLDAGAQALAENAVGANPHDSQFLRQAAGFGIEKQCPALARPALEALLEDGSIEHSELLDLARIYVAEQWDAAPALRVLGTAYENEADIEGLPEALARLLVEAGDHDPRYQQLFERLLTRPGARRDPRYLERAMHLARIHEAQGRYEAMAELLNNCESAAEEASETRRAEFGRLQAVASANLQQFQKAVDHYRRLLENDPEDRQARVGLGQAYARMEAGDPAMLQAIDEARTLAPEDPLLNFACAERAVREQRWGDASNFYLVAAKGGEEYADMSLNSIARHVHRHEGEASVPLRWLRIQVFLALHRYEETLEESRSILKIKPGEAKRVAALFDRILKVEPDNFTAQYGRALMLRRNGENLQASQLLESLLQRQPDNAEVQRLLIESYREILAHSDNATMRFKLGQLAMQVEDYDLAASCFQRTRQGAGLANMSTRYLAKCFFLKGMYDLALQEYQSVAMDEETKPIVYQLGAALEREGNFMGARMAYQRIYGADARYKDVADRINNLTQSSGVQMTVGVDEAQMGPNVDRKTLIDTLSESARQRYEMLEEIGHGAMANVFKVRDTELEEIVALKVLPERLLLNPEALRRFRLEARSARKLTHENIVRIHDIGEEQGKKYISMEFIDGKSLKDKLAAHPDGLDEKTIIHYARQIASAMAYAHSSGLVHRDLKPANIMLTSADQVKVADFGIAKIMDNSEAQTIAGAIVGTPLYMSPEQVMGRACDHRADIYSFGVVLYELLTGKPPFHEGDLAYKHLNEEPPPLLKGSEALRAVIVGCLEKDREKRWSCFDDILERLDKPAGDA